MSTSRNRPLSPHLQVYRLPIEALTSICHRMSGIALMAGAFVLVAWLWALAHSEEGFIWWKNAFASPFGLLCLFGWTLAFFYHLSAGIRHLVWDTGTGLSKTGYRASSWIVIASALILTAATWVAVWPKIGGTP